MPLTVQDATASDFRWRKSFQATNPAAGAEVSITVPAGSVWRVHSVRLTLVTSSVAGNRTVMLNITDGSTKLWQVQAAPTTLQAASTTRRYNFISGLGLAAGADFSGSGNDFAVALPPSIVLPAGFVIASLTTNLDAADDYAVPVLLLDDYAV